MNKILIFIAAMSIAALAAAFASEAFLGLEPCRLCIYQRWPFAIGIPLSIIGLFLSFKRSILGVLSLNFLVNSGIAFYHTGVEQKWWVSAVEGCAVIFPEPAEGQSILDNIMSTPMAKCEDIPWQDPIIGLSMANYNIGFCFGLAVICLVGALRKYQSSVNSVSQ